MRVRRQRWRVLAMRSYDTCQLVTLGGLGPPNAGSEFSVLAPFDRIEPLERAARLRIVRPRRWRQRCRALIATDCGAGELRTAADARIDLMPHQLEPALAIVRGLATRVLLADEVGLGKTIQAGLVITELRARGAADRVLVLTPAGLRDQWRDELRDRFALDFAILDMRETRRRAALFSAGLNPWTTTATTIASIDYVKRPEILPDVLSCRWDVIVVDEAHGVSHGSDRYHAVSSLCRRAAHVILLTATPHSGDRAQFDALCELGSLDTDRLAVFRRDRREVALGAGRRVHSLRVASSAAERRMHELLVRFTDAVRRERGDGDRDVWLALATLHKRALSSAHSLRTSVERRLAALSGAADYAFHQLALPLDDAAGELDPSDQAPAWTSPVLTDASREKRLLMHLFEAAQAAAAGESKLAVLGRFLGRLRRIGESAIVFTEYRDTLTHLQNILRLPCAVLHGGLNTDERRAALDQFRGGRVRVLLATDAGGEGLNLQAAARVVINLELPWTPTRLEQRIGRVDRIGQRRRVHAFNLIAAGTGELRIYERLKTRIARARQDIETADPLSASTDEEVSRLVIAGDEAVEPSRDRSATEASRTFVRFTADAARERERLIWKRAIVDRVDPRAFDVDTDSWIAFARRPLTRMRMAGGILVILRSAIEDSSGRSISSRITGVAISPAVRVRRDQAIDMVRQLFGTAELNVRTANDAHSGSKRFHEDFWRLRLLREQAIAAARADSVGTIFQPGLFDPRVLRPHQSQTAEVDAAIHDAAEFIAAAERALIIDRDTVRPLLVLVP